MKEGHPRSVSARQGDAGSGRPEDRIKELERGLSEREQACEALKKALDEQREIFDSLNEAVFIDDAATGKMIDCNRRTVEMYGYDSREELLAGNIGDLSARTGYSEEKAQDMIRKAVEEGPQTFEWLARKKDGRVFWIEMQLKRVDISGKDRIVATAWDIADRKSAEEELRESEAKFKAFMDSLAGFAFIKDDKRRYVFMSRSLERYFGLGPGEGLGRTFEEIVPLPEAGPIKDHDQAVLLSGRASRSEVTMSLEEEPKVFIVSKFPIVRADGGTMLGGISMDITESRRAVEALRLSEEKSSKAFHSSPLWMSISRMEDGLLLEVNDAFVASTGYAREEAVGRTTTELGLWADPADRKKLVEIVERDGFARDFEAPVRYKSGETGTALWSAELIKLDGRDCAIATMLDITEQRRARANLEQSYGRLQGALIGTVQALAMTTEMRDPYTSGHQKRVALLSAAIAREMGLPDDGLHALQLAASIHDLGKISVPAEILSKPSRISPLEFGLIKGHPEVGYGILKDIDFPWPIARIVLEHHERIDGSGYPKGLKGEETLLESRVLMVADVVEAMATYRPYRPALGTEAALEEITKNKGILYDPAVVEACLEVFRKGYRLE